MGLVVSRFAASDPLSLLPRLRAETEARLRRAVRLKVHPGGAVLVLDGATIVLYRDERSIALRSRELRWSTRRGRELVRRVKDALRPLGGRDVSWASIAYERAPSIDVVASALGARIVRPFEPHAVLTSGLRTPVEIRIDGPTFDLEAPIVIFGKLFDRANDAAHALASPISPPA
jgi:hypothetical protein